MSEPIRTDVGCAGYGDNFVRGVSVGERLAGRETRWGLLSRFLDGPELSREDAAFLDDVLVATVAPDPRIWPLKIGWIIGSYGDWWAAGAAVQGMLAECRMGPWACAAACPTAQRFASLRAEGRGDFRERAVAWAESRWAADETVWGFGVAGGAGRRRDERLAAIDDAVVRHGRADRPHYRASMEAASAIVERVGRFPNMALGVAAIGLDLGMERGRIEALMYQVLEPQILGNAYESSRLEAASLRALEPSDVDYQGAAPRRSPRAQEGSE